MPDEFLDLEIWIYLGFGVYWDLGFQLQQEYSVHQSIIKVESPLSTAGKIESIIIY
jgi:hypothetical protein